jgi:hypothetical protein
LNRGAGGCDDYKELVDRGRDVVLATVERAGLGSLRGHILDEFVIAPPEWRER